MVWLFGFVIAAVGLYFWLMGHWYFRILAFPIIAVMLGLIGYLIGAAIQTNLVEHPEQFDMMPIMGMLLGVLAAWPISGLPGRRRRIVIFPPPGNHLTRSF